MGKIRVLVVDDSFMFRQILVKYLNEDPELQVVAVASDPFEARDKIIECKPDVMTLDIELPKMDGIEFLRKLMPQYPLRTVVISALSERVFDAMHAGAVEFVAKPQASNQAQLEEFVRKELPETVKIAAGAKLRKNIGASVQKPQTAIQNNAGTTQTVKNQVASHAGEGPRPNLKTDTLSMDKMPIVAIGASTGGTEAIASVLKGFGADIPPIVVTQHMPEGFTGMYADRLDKRSGLPFHVKEAKHGDVLKPGLMLLAPGGDKQMEVKKISGGYQILLKAADKVNGHCPSVEVLFDSVAREAGSNAVGIILTGMGGDGAKGLLHMREAGAHTIGQDESTCVVYGMPKVAYELGAVEYQEKLPDVAKRTYQVLAQMMK